MQASTAAAASPIPMIPVAPDEGSPESQITISDVAAAKIQEFRTGQDDAGDPIEPHFGLRVRVKGGGCAGFTYELFFDEPTDLDRRVLINGCDVLVDEMSLMYLVGVQIDYVDGVHGGGFKFQNPNVKSTCGCGSSFSV